MLQAVSYEFQNKLGNLLGPKTFQWFLIVNGIVGPLLLGGAVATFFEGSNFVIEKANLTELGAPIVGLMPHTDSMRCSIPGCWCLVWPSSSWPGSSVSYIL